MKKVVMIFISSIILIALSGCSIFEKGSEKAYDIDDYKIIEIYYGDAIDQELLDQIEDSDETKELIDGADEEGPFYKGNRMCDSDPEENDGYRMLDQRNDKYLVNESNKVNKPMSGVYTGRKTYCNDRDQAKEWPGDDESKRMRELADILMSETKLEITDQEELEKYTELLIGEETYVKTHTYGDVERTNTYGILNIKIVDKGSTRLVRIYEVYEDDDAAVEQISYIQITLSNDTDKFDELYDEIYDDVR